MDQRAQERVAIAKDALAWIKAGALKPDQEGYIKPSVWPHDPVADQQLRDMVLGQCSVCAKGAMFLAKAVRYDNVLAKDWDNLDVMEKALNEHFDVDQLTLIECAFEGWEKTTLSTFGPEVTQKVLKFYAKHPDNKKRLITILKNIIKHDGTFVL